MSARHTDKSFVPIPIAEPEIQARALGVGFVGAQHPHITARVRILEKDPRVRLVGFVEQDEELASQVARRLSLKRYASLDELLDDGLEIAIVEALDPDVPVLADACVGRVRAVLLEKPGAAVPDDLDGYVERWSTSGTTFEFGYEMHYGMFMTHLRQLLSSGCLGQVTLARLHGGCPVGCALELWQSLPEDLGGLGYTEGCHLVELATDLFGLPDGVSALSVKLPSGESFQSPYFKSSLFSESGGGTTVQVGTCAYEDVVTMTLVYPKRLVTIDLTAWESGNWVQDWGIQIYGTNGTVDVAVGAERVRLVLREARGGFSAGETVLDAGQSGLGYMYERQLDSLLRRAVGEPVDEAVDLAAGLGVLQVLAALYRSANASGTLCALQPVSAERHHGEVAVRS